MSTNEQKNGADEKKIYRSPETVRMGDTLDSRQASLICPSLTEA